MRIILFLFLILILFSLTAALYENKFISTLVKTIVPPLSGFHWNRIFILNIPLWYMLFAFVLVQVNFLCKRKWIAYFLAILQLAYILVIPCEYNDTIKTWYNELFYKTGFDRTLRLDKTITKKFAERSDDFISYKEFFDVELFENIKHKIGYANENVAAFGYHPSVLMYNGFYCVDGYNNVIPLAYMRKFGELIQPELLVNPAMRQFYNTFGGKMYLYHDGHDFYMPKREKPDTAIAMRVNMDMLKTDFAVTYVLSRFKILNDEKLTLVGTYTHSKSIYIIYVYKVI